MRHKNLVPDYGIKNNIPVMHIPEKEINIVMDNCRGGLCHVARVILLVRGHTQNDCGQMFNLLKIDYRK
eukprot:7115731-Ditylum_brightwellii.AAC.1